MIAWYTMCKCVVLQNKPTSWQIFTCINAKTNFHIKWVGTHTRGRNYTSEKDEMLVSRYEGSPIKRHIRSTWIDCFTSVYIQRRGRGCSFEIPICIHACRLDVSLSAVLSVAPFNSSDESSDSATVNEKKKFFFPCF